MYTYCTLVDTQAHCASSGTRYQKKNYSPRALPELLAAPSLPDGSAAVRAAFSAVLICITCKRSPSLSCFAFLLRRLRRFSAFFKSFLTFSLSDLMRFCSAFKRSISGNNARSPTAAAAASASAAGWTPSSTSARNSSTAAAAIVWRWGEMGLLLTAPLAATLEAEALAVMADAPSLASEDAMDP